MSCAVTYAPEMKYEIGLGLQWHKPTHTLYLRSLNRVASMGLAKIFCKSHIGIDYMHVVLSMYVVLEDMLKTWDINYEY